MKIENLYPGSWGSNCYILSVGSHAAIVDPSTDAKVIVNALAQRGLSLEFVLLTHGHFDHIVSLDSLRDATGAPAYIHQNDLTFPEDSHKNEFYRFFRMERSYRRPEHSLQDGDSLFLGGEEIRVIHTPGHTSGSVCYLCNNEILLTGDTLFAEGFGRYDLYSGDESTLFQSLREMNRLDHTLRIFPGHGADALLGDALDYFDSLIS